MVTSIELVLRSSFIAGIHTRHVNYTGFRRRTRVVQCVSKNGNSNSGDFNKKFGTQSPYGKWEIDTPVPWDQLPINQFYNLQESKYFSWAIQSVWVYGLNLGTVCTVFSLLLGWPVASLSINPDTNFVKCGIAALSGGLTMATFVALHMYLGWAHIRDRLLSVAVEYEETGWYDGQTWVKPPEVLARDRLVGAYTVKPALSRVKLTLIGLAISLGICVMLLSVIPENQKQQTQDQATTSSSSIKNYSEESARFYEPDVFSYCTPQPTVVS